MYAISAGSHNYREEVSSGGEIKSGESFVWKVLPAQESLSCRGKGTGGGKGGGLACRHKRIS